MVCQQAYILTLLHAFIFSRLLTTSDERDEEKEETAARDHYGVVRAEGGPSVEEISGGKHEVAASGPVKLCRWQRTSRAFLKRSFQSLKA
jgi:hypothetical protein